MLIGLTNLLEQLRRTKRAADELNEQIQKAGTESQKNEIAQAASYVTLAFNRVDVLVEDQAARERRLEK